MKDQPATKSDIKRLELNIRRLEKSDITRLEISVKSLDEKITDFMTQVTAELKDMGEEHTATFGLYTKTPRSS